MGLAFRLVDCSLIILENWISLRCSVRLSTSLEGVDTGASISLKWARWLLKPPRPPVTQIQKPKMKVVPSAGTVEGLMIAIEFVTGSSVISST